MLGYHCITRIVVILIILYCLFLGGAIELTLTREKPDVPSDNHTVHKNTTTEPGINFPVMGYAALIGNTFCMVSHLS